MVKERKHITKTQFWIGVIVIAIIILALFYYADLYDRLTVQEESFVENPIISPDHPLRYQTEFCASKLTDLAHEIHFLEKDIKEEEEIFESEIKVSPEEVIIIEQRELTVIKEEFDEYKSLCDQFDKQPTDQLCNQFLEEAKHNLELAQENAQLADSKGVLESSLHDLRKAKRIYVNLQQMCSI